MNVIAWVAEHIMDFERGRCKGTSGEANVTSADSDYWYYCDWCGQRRRDSHYPACPKYPFPTFSLEELMARLGKLGCHTLVRFDPQRKSHNFTIVLNTYRVTDTDTPLETLCEHLYQQRSTLPWPEDAREPAFFANLRDAIRTLRSWRDAQ